VASTIVESGLPACGGQTRRRPPVLADGLAARGYTRRQRLSGPRRRLLRPRTSRERTTARWPERWGTAAARRWNVGGIGVRARRSRLLPLRLVAVGITEPQHSCWLHRRRRRCTRDSRCGRPAKHLEGRRIDGELCDTRALQWHQHIGRPALPNLRGDPADRRLPLGQRLLRGELVSLRAVFAPVWLLLEPRERRGGAPPGRQRAPVSVQVPKDENTGP